MVTAQESAGHAQRVQQKYDGYGFIAGVALGLLVAVLVSGPYFRDWSVLTSVGVILGGGFVGGIVGYLATSIAACSIVGAGTGALPDATSLANHGSHHDHCSNLSDSSGNCASFD